MKRALVEGLVVAAVRDAPLSTLSELQAAVQATCHVSKSLIATVLRRNGITRKKARFYGQPRDLEAKTARFVAARDAARAAGRTFFSVDEASFGRNAGAAFGYSSRGSKVFIRRQRPRVQTTTVVACVNDTGIVHRSAMHGSCNTDHFLDFLAHCDLPRGAVVLLDNVSFHHARRVAAWALDRGVALLFVPPYSPWFNPIESCFSIVKRSYYKGRAIDDAFATLTSAHCEAFFAKALSATHMY